MLGRGDGTFGAPILYVTEELPDGLMASDLNADGVPDLVATSSKAGVYLGRGDGVFDSPVFYDAGAFPFQVVAGDFNGDGKIDLAVADQNSLAILPGNGDATFQAPLVMAGKSGPLAAGDLNRDGVTDLCGRCLRNVYFRSAHPESLSRRTQFRAQGVSGQAVQRLRY